MRTLKRYFIYLCVMIVAVIAIIGVVKYQFLTYEFDIIITKADTSKDTNGYYTVGGFVDGEKKIASSFQNKDDWFFFHTKSTDIQTTLLPGSKYRLRATGTRISLFSMKPNIIAIIKVYDMDEGLNNVDN